MFQNKSVHFPLRSKYNRLTKLARFLQENPSCLLCNILHHYLQQANHSVIDDATMVSHQLPGSLRKPLFWGGHRGVHRIKKVRSTTVCMGSHRSTVGVQPECARSHGLRKGFGADHEKTSPGWIPEEYFIKKTG